MPKRDKKPSDATRLAQLATPPPPQPAILELNACRIQVTDAHTNEGAQKIVAFIHTTGGFVARTIMPTRLAHDVANMLLAPPGIIIPPNNGDTPGEAT